MNIVMLGAVASGVSGAVGYFLASKFHDEEKRTQIYPLYAVAIFAIVALATRIVVA